MPSAFWRTVLFAGMLSVSTPDSAYDSARAGAIRACEAIDPTQFQTGLALNPAGYRSYYLRSECFQKAATQFRDVTLCDRVRQRRTLLWSSWGYSPGNCRTLVAQAIDADRQELEDLKREYLGNRMVLRDFTIEPNGNGRDYDVIPVFAGANGHGYMLAVEIIPPSGPAVVVHVNGYYVDPRSGLRIYIRQEDIKTRLSAFEPGASYRVRTVATFTVPSGGPSRFMSDAFIERVFPLRERTQSVTREIRF